MSALVAAFSALRLSAQRAAPRPFVAAKSLSSKSNGIAAAPRVALAAQQQRTQQQPAALVVEAADGRKGGKLKTRKSAAKRYKVTGGGKVLVRHSGKQHLNEKMSRKKIRQLSKLSEASATHKALIKGCLPYGGVQ
eukprot:scaffold12.g7943.t1